MKAFGSSGFISEAEIKAKGLQHFWFGILIILVNIKKFYSQALSREMRPSSEIGWLQANAEHFQVKLNEDRMGRAYVDSKHGLTGVNRHGGALTKSCLGLPEV